MSNTFTPIGANAGGFALYGDDAAEAAENAGVPVDFFEQLIANESSFNANAQNPNSSANGIAQFITSTSNYVPGYGPVNSSDPVSSLYAAAEYVAYLFQKTGSWIGAATSYGDLAANNPNAATFTARLNNALNQDNGMTSNQANLVTGASSAVDSFGVGASALFTNPGSFFNELGSEIGGVISNPLSAASSTASSAALGASTATGAASDTASQATSGVLGYVSKQLSVFESQTFVARVVLVVIGVILLIAAVFAFTKTNPVEVAAKALPLAA